MRVIDCMFVLQWVMNAVDSQLFAALGEQYSGLKTQLWSTADEEISLADCHIYRSVTWPRQAYVQATVIKC